MRYEVYYNNHSTDNIFKTNSQEELIDFVYCCQVLGFQYMLVCC